MHAGFLATDAQLARLMGMFDQHVYDWGTCDTICGQVLHEIILKDKKLATSIASWRDHQNIWKKRARYGRVAHLSCPNTNYIVIYQIVVWRL